MNTKKRERHRETVRERERGADVRTRTCYIFWTVPIDRHAAHITATFTNCY